MCDLFHVSWTTYSFSRNRLGERFQCRSYSRAIWIHGQKLIFKGFQSIIEGHRYADTRQFPSFRFLTAYENKTNAENSGHWKLRRILCCSSRKVNYGQSSEILILYFCASMKLCIQPAIHANCLKVIGSSWLKYPPCMKILDLFNLMTSYWVRYERRCRFNARWLHFLCMEDTSVGKNHWFLGSWEVQQGCLHCFMLAQENCSRTFGRLCLNSQ